MSMKIDSDTVIPVRLIVRDGSNAAVSSTTNAEVTLGQLMTGSTPSTAGTAGTVIRQPAIADIGAAPSQANFNALLAALRAAKVLAV